MKHSLTEDTMLNLSCILLLFALAHPVHIDENVAPNARFFVHYAQWTSTVLHGSAPGVEPERLDIRGTARVVAVPAKGRFYREQYLFAEIDATTKAGKVSRVPLHGTFTVERDSNGTPRSPDLGALGYIPAFPGEAVSIGDSWTAEVPTSALNGKGIAQYRYRLEGLRSEGGHQLAQISLVVNGTFVPRGAFAGWNGVETGSGSITWDVERHERRGWNFEIRDASSHAKDSVIVTSGLRARWTAIADVGKQ